MIAVTIPGHAGRLVVGRVAGGPSPVVAALSAGCAHSNNAPTVTVRPFAPELSRYFDDAVRGSAPPVQC